MSLHETPLGAEDEDPVGILFYEALRIPSADRGGFLDERCGGDHLLRREVESMLKDHENAGSFLGSDASAVTQSAPLMVTLEGLKVHH